MKIHRIIEDLGDPTVEIQMLALTTVPRLSTDVTMGPTDLEQLMERVRRLANSPSPDVVFLARKAMNFLSNRTTLKDDMDISRLPSPQYVTSPPAADIPPPAPKEAPPAPAAPAVEAPPPPDPEGLPQLMVALDTTEDAAQIASTLSTVRLRGDRSCLDRLVRFLRHGDPRVRANAVEVFETLGDPKSVDVLMPLLGDENNRVRSNAAKALGRWGVPEVKGCLAGMVASEHVHMRESALYAIANIPDLSPWELLGPLVKDPYEGIRRRLVEYLAGRKESQSTDTLYKMVEDSDSQVRDRSIAALVDRGVPVESLMAHAARPISPEDAVPLANGAPEVMDPVHEALAHQAAEWGFRATLAQILKELRSAEKRGTLARALFQAGIRAFQHCRGGELREPDLLGLYYEVERYQTFLVDYSRRLAQSGVKKDAMQVQILTTGLAQYEGRLKVSLLKMGRMVAQRMRSGELPAPDELKRDLADA